MFNKNHYMIEINGNVLVFTDQHFGVKGNAPSRQKISTMAIKNILMAVDKNNVSNIIFCGDYFHQRNALTVDTLNIAYRCLQALAKKCNVYMILGNHDLFNKNSTDVNSINIFRDNENIYVIDKATEVKLNGIQIDGTKYQAGLTAEEQMKLDVIELAEDYGDNWSTKT